MYRIQVGRRAERGLRGIRHGDPAGYRRVVAALRALADDPRPAGATKLVAFDPPAWRIRLGQYRIVYEVDDGVVLVIVVNVAPRGEVYR
jgi:Cytotoxic translational repressor of toxin-antitoxin stability system